MKIFASLIIAFSSALVLNANAAVIWDESIDGNSAGMPSLTLQLGTNEILGTSRWIGDELDPFQFTERDWFGLTLQNGLSIQSITTKIINPVLVSSDSLESLWAQASWTLQDSSYNFKWYEYTRHGESSPYASFDEFPLTGFNNFLLNQAAGLSASNPFDLSWEYKVTIEVVESVPEPSSLLLALVAFFAIFLSQRSRITKFQR